MQIDSWKMLLLIAVVSMTELMAQVNQQPKTLVVQGLSGQAAVVQVEGRPYVDLQALAEITNGSLNFKANRIIFALPGTAENTSQQPEQPGSTDPAGLSREFTKQGIETIALMREWASPLAYAIQNGYQVTEGWVAPYREQAANGLRMASLASSTDADRNALQLLTNEFEAVREWSSKLVAARAALDTAKYATSPNALRDDPLSQKIITCGHFLGSMLGSGSFQDDSSCH